MQRNGQNKISLFSKLTFSKFVNAFFACFRPYVRQPDDHIGWATSMPFASINSTDPRTNPAQFREKILRIDGFEKRSFFESAVLEIFFAKSHEKQSKVLGEQGWVEIFMFTLVSSPWGLGPTLMHRTVIWIEFKVPLHFNKSSAAFEAPVLLISFQ